MDDDAFTIKTALSLKLKKQGSSLQELETSLSELCTKTGTEKTAAMLKSAFGITDATKILGALSPIETLKTLATLAAQGATVSAAGGLGAGAGAATVAKKLDREDKDLSKKEIEKQHLEEAIARIQAEYGVA